jgi:hypothetical protein
LRLSLLGDVSNDVLCCSPAFIFNDRWIEFKGSPEAILAQKCDLVALGNRFAAYAFYIPSLDQIGKFRTDNVLESHIGEFLFIIPEHFSEFGICIFKTVILVDKDAVIGIFHKNPVFLF